MRAGTGGTAGRDAPCAVVRRSAQPAGMANGSVSMWEQQQKQSSRERSGPESVLWTAPPMDIASVVAESEPVSSPQIRGNDRSANANKRSAVATI